MRFLFIFLFLFFACNDDSLGPEEEENSSLIIGTWERYDTAIGYYLEEEWKTKLTKDTINIINETVDKKIMKYFKYEIL